MLFLLVVTAGIAVVFLCLWLSLRQSLKEMTQELQNILLGDTNQLITLSTADPAARQAADTLNDQLRELRKQKLRLQNGDAELKTAITNISHDIRTPLTAICGYLDLLEGEKMPEQSRKYLNIIRERTDVMTSLTEELFRYSIVNAEEESLQLEPVRLNDVLEVSLAAFYGVLTEKGITPEISMPEEPVVRILDRKALERVFGNLLSNAARYAEGALTVCLTEDGSVWFENPVENLTDVDAKMLFHRFYTVERGKNSTGLGLAIAKQLTERMGGTITANVENKKLRVTVRF